MANVKLQHNVTGAISEKSELNWKHLPKDRKGLYTVIEAGSTAKPIHFSPPELKPKPIVNPAENKEKTPLTSTAPITPAPAADETQDQKIIRLFKAGAPKDEAAEKELIKSIAKEVAAHYKSVEKVLKPFLKAK